MKLIFIIPIFFLLTCIILKKPSLGLGIYISLIPLESIRIFDLGGLTLIKLYGFYFSLIVLYKNKLKLRLNKISFIIITFLTICLISLLIVLKDGSDEINQGYSITLYFSLLSIVLVSFIVSTCANNTIDFIEIGRAVSISGVIYSILIIISFVNNMLGINLVRSQLDSLRGEIFINDPNYLALYLNLMLISNYNLIILNRRSNLRKLFIFSTPIIVVGIIFTLSRLGMILLIFNMIFYLYRYKKNISKANKIILSLFIIIGLLLISSKFNYILIERYKNIEEDISLKGRIWALLSGINMFKDNILFGVGFGTFAERYFYYRPINAYFIERIGPHNSWIGILAETGIIGIIIWILLIYHVLKLLSRIKYDNIFYPYFYSSFISLLMSSFVLTLHINKIFWIFLSIIVHFIYKNSVYVKNDISYK